jgi:hypothetical protein
MKLIIFEATICPLAVLGQATKGAAINRNASMRSATAPSANLTARGDGSDRAVDSWAG